MKMQKRVVSLLMAVVVAVCVPAFFAPLAASAGANERAGSASELAEAIKNVSNNGTVTLTADINYNTGIVVSEKSFTINLNGKTLNITALSDISRSHYYVSGFARPSVIYVFNGHTLTIIGPGMLNVDATEISRSSGVIASGAGSTVKTTGGAAVNVTGNQCGVMALQGAHISITGNAIGNGADGQGAHANEVSMIDIGGNAIGTQFGALAGGGSVINVAGNAEGNDYGVYAQSGSIISVGGNATGLGEMSAGVDVSGGAAVYVAGNASGVRYGVSASHNGTQLTVGGNATGTGPNSYGVRLNGGGKKVYIIGEISGGIRAVNLSNHVGGVMANHPAYEPARTNVQLPAPYDGYYWDEYRWFEDDPTQDYVYKRREPIAGYAPADTAKIEAFVTRLYRNVLGRTPDPEGLESWVARLAGREWGGGQVAENFFFGAPYYEFLNRGLDNEQFLYTMYTTFMDREPEEYGWIEWLDRMNKGMTWTEVFEGFVASEEWGGICDAAGIRR